MFSTDRSEAAANSAALADCLAFDASAQPIPFVDVEIMCHGENNETCTSTSDQTSKELDGRFPKSGTEL